MQLKQVKSKIKTPTFLFVLSWKTDNYTFVLILNILLCKLPNPIPSWSFVSATNSTTCILYRRDPMGYRKSVLNLEEEEQVDSLHDDTKICCFNVSPKQGRALKQMLDFSLFRWVPFTLKSLHVSSLHPSVPSGQCSLSFGPFRAVPFNL